MNTSLNGKALGFGSSKYRFESYVFNIIKLKPNIYIYSHINFIFKKYNQYLKLFFSYKILIIIKILVFSGYLYKFFISKFSNYYYIFITLFFYKYTPFFKSFILISSQIKKYYINFKTLRLLAITLKTSILIISSSQGLITHTQALKLKLGGIILYVIS